MEDPNFKTVRDGTANSMECHYVTLFAISTHPNYGADHLHTATFVQPPISLPHKKEKKDPYKKALLRRSNFNYILVYIA
jgi:hypothetical protein